MAVDGNWIWVICRDLHGGGVTPPILATLFEDEARAIFAAMQKGSYERLALFKVPRWPDVVQQETERKEQ